MTDPTAINSAVVAVGDELLFGMTVDGNGSWLSKKLTEMGAPVSARWVIGDDPTAIKRTVLTALGKSDLVIVCGGLGPTSDDRTRPAVADLFGLKLVIDQGLADKLHGRFSSAGHGTLPTNNLAQAEVPEGSIVVPNYEGTAPGLIIEEGKKSVVLLPGVPHEMRLMFDSTVTDYINQRFQLYLNPILHRTFNTSGIPESLLAEKIGEHVADFPSDVSLAFLPGLQGVSVRLTTTVSSGEGIANLDFCENLIGPHLNPYCYSVGKKSLIEAVADRLLIDKKSFAVSESCTGGFISKLITDYPGSSRYFKGAIVAYDPATKSDILGIERSLIEKHGIVSETIASAMAEKTADIMNTDFAIGLTGVAGPEGGSLACPVGTVCYAVAGGGRVVSFRKRFMGDRTSIRERATQAALFSLFQILTKNTGLR